MQISKWLFQSPVGSTSEWLKSNYTELPIHTCVYTDYQSNGRGRGHNQWFSPVGGLYFSVLLSKGPLIPDANYLMTHFSHHAREFLNKRYDLKIVFKDPNDLYARNRKLMGVLIDNVFMGNTLCASILGVGLNVNFEFDEMDQASPLNAISLKELLDSTSPIDSGRLMIDLLESYQYAELEQ